MELFKYIFNSLKRAVGIGGKSPAENSDYARIIEKINNSELVPDEHGFVILPPDLSAAVEGGRVLVGENSESKKMVVFPNWRGKGFNLQGFLFLRGGLREEDVFTDYYGNKSIKIGSIEYVVEERIAEDWYKISRGLD